jgi:hypothetical protein
MNAETNNGHEIRMLSDAELEMVSAGTWAGMKIIATALVEETVDTVVGVVHDAAQWVADHTKPPY